MNHLTHQQLCDLLIDSAPDAASSAHLAVCPDCTADLASLKASLATFRQASIHLAEREISRRPLLLPERRTRRSLVIPAYVAAAAVLAAALFVPLLSNSPETAGNTTPALVNTATTPTQTAESDEALFEEINRQIATAVPSPLQPLANPTGLPEQGGSR